VSKLDNIIIECANKVLDGKEEKLGDYIDPTKEEIKALILELIKEEQKNWGSHDNQTMHAHQALDSLSNTVEEL
jgi:hypothetical protein